MPRLPSILARIRIALRVLANPAVKPGKLLGDRETGTNGGADPVHLASSCPPDGIVVLDRCSLCGGAERTLVGEFNRFVHFAHPPDDDAIRADYSLCHQCGAVYAARRPTGARYRWLLEHFEETLGRVQAGETRSGKFAISSSALSDEDREHLRRLAARGVFVSEHTHPPRNEYLPALLADRLSASLHVEILGSLLDLKGRRVLEVRSRLGSIASALQRLYGTDVSAMSIFEGQRYLIGEVYGIPATSIDFDNFQPPQGGPWDLIVCNHMLTHAVRPHEMLATLRAHLVPGGHVYFYNESDDAEILVDRKSMFNVLNAFHLQTFDLDALVRAISASGFSTIFLTRRERTLLCLAQATEISDAWPRIGKRDLRRRRESYLNARDAALLRLPESARWRIGEEWPLVIERALKAGHAEMSAAGEVRVRQPDRAER